MDSSFSFILSHIPRQYHSSPNNIVKSIVLFNRRCLKLSNDPRVNRIVQSMISQSIKRPESIKFRYKEWLSKHQFHV